MDRVESKITSKGQVSIPAAVRKRLDLGPGARIEWLEKDGELIVRRASRYSSDDIHSAIFDEKERSAVPVEQMKSAIKTRKRNARG